MEHIENTAHHSEQENGAERRKNFAHLGAMAAGATALMLSHAAEAGSGPQIFKENGPTFSVEEVQQGEANSDAYQELMNRYPVDTSRFEHFGSPLKEQLTFGELGLAIFAEGKDILAQAERGLVDDDLKQRARDCITDLEHLEQVAGNDPTLKALADHYVNSDAPGATRMKDRLMEIAGDREV